MAREKKPRYEKVTDDPAVREHIRRLVDEAPPLSTSQIARLRVLLRVDADTPRRGED